MVHMSGSATVGFQQGTVCTMDAVLLWTAAGSAAGVIAVGIAAWQVRLQRKATAQAQRKVVEQAPLTSNTDGLPVAAPLGRLPPEVRGRDDLLAELSRPLTRRRHRSGVWVLAGMGGLGKSTVALAIARAARTAGWRVWWVTSTDSTSLLGGMLEVLRQMGAPEAVTRSVREGAPIAAERAWEFLNDTQSASSKWLLVFDNADEPNVLAAPGGLQADYTGWLRADPTGMVLVTTRTRDPRVWGSGVSFRELRPLDDAAAARVLTDLAPRIRDPEGEQSKALARRLGGLPLALHLAGAYLASPLTHWHSFDDYHQALDSVELPAALADIEDLGADGRATIHQTWDLSLNALAADGRPQTRLLLFLLSCYAPAIPIPVALLQGERLTRLLTPAGKNAACDESAPKGEGERNLRSGLRGLASVGLIDIANDNDLNGAEIVTVHPVVADANRCRILTAGVSEVLAIGDTAVSLLQAASLELDPTRAADWPTWRRLVPHVTVTLEWLSPHLAPEAFASLLEISTSAGHALRQGGNFAAAETLARAGLTAAAALLGDDHVVCLSARSTLAKAIGRQGRNREAELLHRELLTDQQRILGNDHPETLVTRHNIGWMIEHQGRYREAELLYLDLLSDQQRIHGIDHPLTLQSRHRLARLASEQGRYAEAEQLYQEVLAEQRRVLGEEHAEVLITGHNLAVAIAGQGRYAEAERLLRDVIARRQLLFGADHPAVLTSLNNLAWIIADQGRYEEAEQICLEVLPGRQLVLGDHHPATLTTRHRLAWIIGRRGKFVQAAQMLRQVLADRQRVLGNDHPATLATRHRLACLIADQGRNEEAGQTLRRVLADRQRIIGDQHPDTLTTAHRLARVVADQGRYNEAEQMLRQLLEDSCRVLGEQHPSTISARQDLSRLIATRNRDTD